MRSRRARVSCWMRRRTSPGRTREAGDVEGTGGAGVAGLVIGSVLAFPGRDSASQSGHRRGTVRRTLLARSCIRCQTCLGPVPTSGS